MSQGEPQTDPTNNGWPTLKSEVRLNEFMARFEESAAAVPPASSLNESDADILIAVVQEVKAEQAAQQTALNDLQRQIDLQRLETAELMGRSQSSSAALEKFEEVAQSTAGAA